MAIEYRCTCNRCQSNWIVNDAMIQEVRRLRAGEKLNMLNAAAQASSNSVASVYATSVSDRYGNRVTDPSRCPKCGSINIQVNIHQY